MVDFVDSIDDEIDVGEDDMDILESLARLAVHRVPPPAPVVAAAPDPPAPVVPSASDVYGGIREHIKTELATLRTKQQELTETINTKTRELTTARETLLVLSGALQGLEHMLVHVEEKDKALPSPDAT